MKTRFDMSLTLHSLLAALSCTGAYIAWSAPNFVERDSAIAVYAGDADRLKSIAWQDMLGTLRIERDAQKQVLVRLVPPAQAAPTAGNTALAFPGNMQANDCFARVMPLLAVRKLGAEALEKAKSLGLQPPQAALTLVREDGSEVRLDIGKQVYGGSDVYVRAADDAVYLVRGSVFANLRQGAVGLQNRQLLPIGISALAKVVIHGQVNTKTLVQQRDTVSNRVYFVDPEHPEHKLSLASEWIERLLRLRATDAREKAPSAPPQVTVTFFDEQAQIGELRLYKSSDSNDGQAAQPTSVAADALDAFDALAVSSFLPHPAVVASIGVEPLLRDLTAVLADGQAAPEQN